MAPPLVNWKILSKKNLTHDVFELKVQRPEGFNFKAGQYISIVIPGAGPGGRNLRRAYSIASPPEWPEIEICIKLVQGGPGTTYLNSLNEGQEFQGQAPFGDFYLEHDQSLPTLFIGTGTGIAPLRSMILSNEWTSSAPAGFLLGVRSEKDIIYPELFSPNAPKPLSSQKHVQIALSRPEKSWPAAVGQEFHGHSYKGRVTNYIQDLDQNHGWDFAKSHYYLCGSGDMIAEVKNFLTTKGVTKEQIHTEKYF